MISNEITSFSFGSSGDKQKQHFIYDTTSALGRLHSHTHHRRAASWQHTGVYPQAHRRQALGWRGRRSHLFVVGGRNAPWPWGGKTLDGGSRKRTEALRYSDRRNIMGRMRLSPMGVAMVRKVGLCRKSVRLSMLHAPQTAVIFGTTESTESTDAPQARISVLCVLCSLPHSSRSTRDRNQCVACRHSVQRI